jgi:hypothetical protein
MVSQILEELEIDPVQAKDWMRGLHNESKQTMKELRSKADKGLRLVGEELKKLGDFLTREKTPKDSASNDSED